MASKSALWRSLVEPCNCFLYKHMYGHGSLDFRSSQHRDLVRTFYAGVVEVLIATGQRDRVEEMVDDYRLMTEDTWLPGDEFKPPRGYGEPNRIN